MPQIDPQQVVKDPNFLGLPPQEQMKVLARIDPNYAALPPAEQSRVIGVLASQKPPVNSSGIDFAHLPAPLPGPPPLPRVPMQAEDAARYAPGAGYLENAKRLLFAFMQGNPEPHTGEPGPAQSMLMSAASPAGRNAGSFVEDLKNSPVAEILKNVRASMLEKQANRLNMAANVGTGRKGVQAAVQGDEAVLKTNPGRAAVQAGASATDSPAQLFVKTTLHKRQLGQQITQTLANAPQATVDISSAVKGMDYKIVTNALEQTGIVDPSKVTPLQAHKFRTLIGDKIPWNSVVATDRTADLKDVYFGVNKVLDSAIPGIRDLNKQYQEALLYSDAAKHVFEQMPGAKLNPWVRTTLKKGAIGAGLVGGGYEAERAIRHMLVNH